MAVLYTKDEDRVRFVATWIAKIDIKRRDTARETWEALLDDLARLGKLRDCIEAARRAHSGHPQISFLDELLARGRYEDDGRDEAGEFDPFEFLGLFDRSTESDHLVIGLEP